ncbi:hypothetical protein ACIBG0_02515 [Nocardia sp. NPDC050630]|uniref:hypothetical protein n=1 Tax=Nocardia sp. NPDC050630 TaxID=3364321 RepID=UPI00379A4357
MDRWPLPEQKVPQTVDPGVVARIVTDVYELCRADNSGEFAVCIPELAAVQPDSFGLCLAPMNPRAHPRRSRTIPRAIAVRDGDY